MNLSTRLFFTTLLFSILSLVFHYILPNQTADIQLHDTYIVLKKASIFFPYIFFFFFFGVMHLYLEKKEVIKLKGSKYHYWISMVLSIIITGILLIKAWWMNQSIPIMGSPELYRLINIENRLTLCVMVLLIFFLIFQAAYFIIILISAVRKSA